ncbi:MAG: phosphate/phosphite/phosphonate ABC transporter substrate-binding protein [Myxococcota bacterium]
MSLGKVLRRLLLGITLFGAALPIPAHAQEALMLGVFPRRSPDETYEMFSPLAQELGRRVGRKVELRATRDFEAFWDQVSKGRFDVVHFNQYHYMRAKKELGYEVVAINKEFGSATIAGAIIVRKDAGINSALDLKGKKIVFGGGKTAMQSYIVATWLLRQAGLKAGEYTEEFSLNPPNAVLAAFQGLAAAGGIGDQVLKLQAVTSKVNVDDMKILLQSEQMAQLPWALRKGLPKDMRDKLEKALLGLVDDEAGRKVLKGAKLDALVAAKDSDFDSQRKIVAEVLGEKY